MERLGPTIGELRLRDKTNNRTRLRALKVSAEMMLEFLRLVGAGCVTEDGCRISFDSNPIPETATVERVAIDANITGSGFVIVIHDESFESLTLGDPIPPHETTFKRESA